MNFEQWLEQNQYDVDFGDDTIDLMKQAYVAGLKTAFNIIVNSECEGGASRRHGGDFYYIVHLLKSFIEESE